MSTIEPPAHVLSDDQVESLLVAIEKTPAASGGKTSELTELAALYLTSIDATEAKNDFALVLNEESDVRQVKIELDSFSQILEEFERETAQDNEPEITQTLQRLETIVNFLEQKYNKLSAEEQKTQTESVEKTVADPLISQNVNEETSSTHLISGSDLVSNDQESVKEQNWLCFAGFAVFAILIVLAVVALVRWLRKRNESAKPESKESNDNSGAFSENRNGASELII